MATPNMGLTEPTPSVTTGPTWATQLNAALDLLDAHDHSAGKGAPVTPAGLSMTADLPMGGNRLTNCGGVVLANAGAISNLQAYSNGTDMLFRDSAANTIQLTKSGQPNVATIPGKWGAASTNIVSVAVNTVLVAAGSEYIIIVDMSGGAKTITLPAISTVPGRMYILKEKTGTVNVLTVTPNGTDKIDNVNASKTFSTAFSITRLVADPTLVTWWII